MPLEPMVDALHEFPDHLTASLEAAADRVDVSGPRAIVLAGMGGSGIGGALVEGVFGAQASVPIVPWNNETVPGFVGPDDLVIAVSYSGNTAETLSATRGAAERGASIAAVTTGGKLGALVSDHGAPVVEVPAGMHPRNALGWLFGATAQLAADTGVIDGGVGALAKAARAVADLPAQLLDDGSSLAHVLADRVGPEPVDAVGHDVMGVVARRFACQLNENAKVAATWHVLPEAAHNAIVPWGAGAPDTRLALLRRERESPYEAARFDHLVETSNVADLVQVRIPGEGLEQVLRALLIVDAASILVTKRLERDAEFIEPIDQLKARLASVDDAGAA